jgi:hypothetical protein
MTCITYACFWQGSNGPSKSTLKVPREDGASLGLELSDGNDADWYTVRSVGPGAVQEYNAALPEDSENRIVAGDVIWKIDGSSGKSLMTALKRTTKKTISIVTSRSSLPQFLRFLQNPGKPSMAERVLLSSGSKRFFRTFSRIGGVGFTFWAISGYPVASLPSYFVISALTSFATTRCCHDDRVAGGVPHCYKGGAKIENVVQKVATKVFDFGKKVAKDPKSYAVLLLYGS